MAHHLLAIPLSKYEGTLPAIDVILKDFGLEDHEGGQPTQVDGEGSPLGERSLLIGWPTPQQSDVSYKPDKQTWVHSVNGYEVGIWTDNPPTESDLRRSYTQHGMFIRINGDSWKLPLPQTLNQDFELADDGSIKFVPRREYAWYTSEMEKRREEARIPTDELGEDGEKVPDSFSMIHDPADVLQLAVRALRINYRITIEVAAMIKLLGSYDILPIYCNMLKLQKPTDEQIGTLLAY